MHHIWDWCVGWHYELCGGGGGGGLIFTNDDVPLKLLATYVISSCCFLSIFEDNVGSNGIVSIGYTPFAFLGRNKFIGNRGTSALQVIAKRKQNHGLHFH